MRLPARVRQVSPRRAVLPPRGSLRVDLCDRVTGKHKLRRVDVDELAGRRQRRAFFQQIFQPVDHAPGFPFIHALAQQPHAVHIFEKANLPADTAEIREILCARFVRNARRMQNRSNERPSTGTDECPVVSGRGNPAIAEAVS